MHSTSRYSNLILVLLAFVFLGFTACKKKEIKGPQGDPGVPGNMGNSEIISSEPFVISHTQWLVGSDNISWHCNVVMPQITKEIAELGVVKVFIQQSGSWWELPLLQGEAMMHFGFEEGMLRLVYTDPHGNLPDKPVTSTYRITTFSEKAKAAKQIQPSDDLRDLTNEKLSR